MNKYLFVFSNCSILVNANTKIEAINTMIKEYDTLMERDQFQVIKVSAEITEDGTLQHY